MALNLQIKPKKRLVREKTEVLEAPKALNEVWSMDFMRGSLSDHRGYRLFNVIDDDDREALGMEIGLS